VAKNFDILLRCTGFEWDDHNSEKELDKATRHFLGMRGDVFQLSPYCPKRHKTFKERTSLFFTGPYGCWKTSVHSLCNLQRQDSGDFGERHEPEGKEGVSIS